MEAQLINIKEITIHHNLDDAFIESLESYELVEFVVKDVNRYIYADHLPRVEQIIRLYYDLDINMEGIQVIKHMLDRMENLQNTIRQLENKLNIYE